MGDTFHDEQQRLDASVPMLSARDTQFQGFAQLLYADLAKNVLLSPHKGLSAIEAFKEEQHRIIAQHAYDLVRHTLSNIAPIDLDRLSLDEQVETIPDMTEWPK